MNSPQDLRLHYALVSFISMILTPVFLRSLHNATPIPTCVSDPRVRHPVPACADIPDVLQTSARPTEYHLTHVVHAMLREYRGWSVGVPCVIRDDALTDDVQAAELMEHRYRVRLHVWPETNDSAARGQEGAPLLGSRVAEDTVMDAVRIEGHLDGANFERPFTREVPTEIGWCVRV